jgi:hypothetical protein
VYKGVGKPGRSTWTTSYPLRWIVNVTLGLGKVKHSLKGLFKEFAGSRVHPTMGCSGDEMITEGSEVSKECPLEVGQ